MSISEIKAGVNLPEIRRNISQNDINLYAKASRDFNPIHIDEEFAKKSLAGGTIAHGMLILAYVSQMMTEAFGENWLTGGKLNIRFKFPARPGDMVTVQGKIEQVNQENGQGIVFCSALCINQKGETVITGEATVRIKNDKDLG